MKEVHVFWFGKGELPGTHCTGSPCKRSSTARPLDKFTLIMDTRTQCSTCVFNTGIIRGHLNNAVI